MNKAGPGPFLEGKCLVAMPSLQDAYFVRSVVYICAHSEEGAMGIIVNHPAQGVNFVDLLLQLKVIESEARPRVAETMGRHRVLAGGPVDASRGFVLHSPDYRAAEATMAIDDSVSMTATLDVLRAIAQGEGPEQAVLALGLRRLVGGPARKGNPGQQLDDLPGRFVLLFDQEHEAKYERALGAIGVDLRFLADDAGHA